MCAIFSCWTKFCSNHHHLKVKNPFFHTISEFYTLPFIQLVQPYKISNLDFISVLYLQSLAKDRHIIVHHTFGSINYVIDSVLGSPNHWPKTVTADIDQPSQITYTVMDMCHQPWHYFHRQHMSICIHTFAG